MYQPTDNWIYYEDLAKQLRDTFQGKGQVTKREQRCLGCNTILALQFSNNLAAHDGDFFMRSRDGIWRKGRWFGNFVKCPVCGREGKLPMDKPLNWESMQTRKETAKGVV
jgi:uncharacterized protein with PIN domain